MTGTVALDKGRLERPMLVPPGFDSVRGRWAGRRRGAGKKPIRTAAGDVPEQGKGGSGQAVSPSHRARPRTR